MGPLLSAMVLAAALEPFPPAGESPEPLPDDALNLEQVMVAAQHPMEFGLSGGAIVGPGLLRGVASGIHGGYQLQNGLAPDLEVTVVRWAFATGFDVMPGLRLAVVDGRLRPYLDFHMGTRIFPAQHGSLFDGISAGISASTGVDVMITQMLGVGLHAKVDAMFPSVVSWADLGGGLCLRI